MPGAAAGSACSGQDGHAARSTLSAPPDGVGTHRVFVQVPRDALPGEQTPMTLTLEDTDTARSELRHACSAGRSDEGGRPRRQRARHAGSPGCSSPSSCVVVAVNGIMIWFALTSWTGLATNEAYDGGLTYNRNLEAARRRRRWAGTPSSTRTSPGRQPACADLAAGRCAGAAARRRRGDARLERPTSEGDDFGSASSRPAPGVYRAQFALPLTGAWNAHVTIQRGDDLFVTSSG